MKKKREGNREATGEVFFSIRFPVSLFFLLGVGKERAFSVIALEVTLAESPRATVQASAEARRPMLDQGWMMGEPPTAGGRRVSFARGGGSERGGPLDSSPVPDH
jgi:hypothetical protein